MLGQQHGDLSALVRDKILSGELPKDRPVKVWAGYGTGKTCDLPTTKADIEYEADMADGRTPLFHQPCLTLWHQERARYLRPQLSTLV